MDISLLIFAVNLPNSSYHRGDVVDVGLRHYDGCHHPRFVLVHIEGVPDLAPEDIQLRRLKQMLERHTIKGFGEEVRRRSWRVDVASLPTAIRNELLTNREYTVTWTQAKNYLGKKVVTNEDDPDTDTLTLITDGDV